MREYSLVIIGGGAAGMSAAYGAYQKGIRSILIVERDIEYGGILQQCIHNGFGLHTFNEELSGPAYAQKTYDQIKDTEIEIQYETVVTKINEDLVLTLQSEKGLEKVQAKAIIMATGCRERSAGAIGLKGKRAQGIYTAGCAQKYLNMSGIMVGKRVFILGSGDIGLIMARRMSLEGAKVVGVAEIMPYSNGLARNIKQCLDDFDIPLYLSHTVTAVHGYPRVQSITLAEVDENRKPIEDTKREIEVDCLLLSVGLIPDNALLEDIGVDIDPVTKGPIVNDQMMTSIPGIFACGNTLHVHDLVDYVSLEAKHAGENAADYIANGSIRIGKLASLCGNGIGYVVPQYFTKGQDVEFSFRVKNIYKNATIRISGGFFEKKIKQVSLVPSEMIKITLTAKELRKVHKSITWEVEE